MPFLIGRINESNINPSTHPDEPTVVKLHAASAANLSKNKTTTELLSPHRGFTSRWACCRFGQRTISPLTVARVMGWLVAIASEARNLGPLRQAGLCAVWN